MKFQVKFNQFSYQTGFAYIWMLSILIVLSFGLGQWAANYATIQQREKEQELLRIGLMYRDAIYRYYDNSPAGLRKYPTRLEDLLKDPRDQQQIVRYLRKLEKDPITNQDFMVIRNQDGFIVGVKSRSKKRPIKQKNFLPSIQKFENAKNYEDWVFEM